MTENFYQHYFTDCDNCYFKSWFLIRLRLNLIVHNWFVQHNSDVQQYSLRHILFIRCKSSLLFYIQLHFVTVSHYIILILFVFVTLSWNVFHFQQFEISYLKIQIEDGQIYRCISRREKNKNYTKKQTKYEKNQILQLQIQRRLLFIKYWTSCTLSEKSLIEKELNSKTLWCRCRKVLFDEWHFKTCRIVIRWYFIHIYFAAKSKYWWWYEET